MRGEFDVMPIIDGLNRKCDDGYHSMVRPVVGDIGGRGLRGIEFRAYSVLSEHHS